jgi:hypothetical protein
LLLLASASLAALGLATGEAQAQTGDIPNPAIMSGDLGSRYDGYAQWVYRQQQIVPLPAVDPMRARGIDRPVPRTAKPRPLTNRAFVPVDDTQLMPLDTTGVVPMPSVDRPAAPTRRTPPTQSRTLRGQGVKQTAYQPSTVGPSIRPIYQEDLDPPPLLPGNEDAIPFTDEPIVPEDTLPPLPMSEEPGDENRGLDYKCPDHGGIKPIGQLTDLIGPEDGALPKDCPVDRDTPNMRGYPCMTFTWKASALCHKPLLFEEIGLERYGHTICPAVQPIISGGVFFANVALMPYKTGLNPPWECQYVLGYYRPGSCAPFQRHRLPLEPQAIALQAVAVAGLVALVP